MNTPLNVFKELITKYDLSKALFEVKVYERPNVESHLDGSPPHYHERKTVQVPGLNLMDQDVDSLHYFVGAQAHEDIAISNRVDMNVWSLDPNLKVYRWMPTMDFISPPQYQHTGEMMRVGDPNEFRMHSDVATQVVRACEGLPDFSLYLSGRSFHGYSVCLRNHEEWVQYMARMLLLNSPMYGDAVDSRWIGHALERNQGYLRLSAKSTGYKRVPEFCQKL